MTFSADSIRLHSPFSNALLERRLIVWLVRFGADQA
jgi:hypothetical protein